jgi:hypothetical protein
MSPEQYEKIVHDERTAFALLFGSLHKIAEIPLSDDPAVTAQRACAARLKGRWSAMLRRLDDAHRRRVYLGN